MSESYTSDESARRDRIVDAEIAEAPKGRKNAFTIMLFSLILAAGSAVFFKEWLAATPFVALPVMNVIKDFLNANRRSTSQAIAKSDDSDEDN